MTVKSLLIKPKVCAERLKEGGGGGLEDNHQQVCHYTLPLLLPSVIRASVNTLSLWIETLP